MMNPSGIYKWNYIREVPSSKYSRRSVILTCFRGFIQFLNKKYPFTALYH